MLNSPSMTGIIQSIIDWVDCWRGSAEGVDVIFCCTQVEAPTNRGIITFEGSGSARLSQRNWLLRGTASWTNGTQEYSLSERFTSLSGLVGRVCTKAWNNPIHIGNWITMGPRQPMGLTPASRYIRIVSWESLLESPLYLSRSCWSFG